MVAMVAIYALFGFAPPTWSSSVMQQPCESTVGHVCKALKQNDDNRTHAAKALGISRRALIYKLKKHGLS